MINQKNQTAAAFLSYTHFDDEHNRGTLTKLRQYLSAEVRAQTGEEFLIFQDREHIEWGQKWRERIDQAISGTTFLIPVITPSFFKSQECRAEVGRFLAREKDLNRDDLILPLYFIDTPMINDQTKRLLDPLAEAIASHQYADWRELRFEPFTAPIVRKALETLAVQIRSAIERSESLFQSANQAAIVSPQPGLQPPKEDKGLVEAQEAAQDANRLLAQIAEELKNSTDKVNQRIDQISGGSQDAKIASLIAADMNSGTVKIDKLLANVEEDVNVFVDFFSGYIPELEPSYPDDLKRLTNFRSQFIALSGSLSTALERIRSNRNSGSKLALSSETIRASRRRAESLNKLISSMEKLQDCIQRSLRTIDDKLNPQ